MRHGLRLQRERLGSVCPTARHHHRERLPKREFALPAANREQRTRIIRRLHGPHASRRRGLSCDARHSANFRKKILMLRRA